MVVSPSPSPSPFQFIAPAGSSANFHEFPQLLLLSSCKSVREIKQIHASIIKANTTRSTTTLPIISLCTKITSLLQQDVHLADSIQNLWYASSLANFCHQNPVYIFNAIIQSLSTSNNTFTHIFSLYRQMLLIGLSPDTYTLPYLLKACSQSHAFIEALQIHAHSIKTGLSSNLFVKNTLMRFYAVSGFIEAVEKVFDQGPHWDLISWTTLIQAYSKMGYPSEAIAAFFRMNCTADRMTLVVVLSACSQLGDFTLGKKILAYMDHHLFDVHSDVFLGNALLDMYLKCGQPHLARQLFHLMPVKNLVSWNSMISGLAHQGLFKEALHMFRRMQTMGLKPDSVTLVGVLNSCANLGDLELGKWVHSYIDKNHMKADGYVANALVDMYAKCGSIDQAFMVFQAMKCKDVYSYTAMIVGFAMHGKADRALAIFSEMPRMGVRPDHVTLVGVLSACSHAGLLEEGRRHFQDMSRLYHLQPQTEHYGCMVDLLGRAGLISEAEAFTNKMPIVPDASVWGSLLGACKIHAKVELGETVIQKLIEMEPERDGAYILMSNIYSSANRWRDALKWRKAMKQNNIKKTPGCSSIEVDGMVHEFRKGEKSHPKSREMISNSNIIKEVD
ncbi:pentatricopeptide repeat-containing protein, putative [Ricinus communis]|uniref:Pentatricopeptide repeat-containing protein, putative n=1 Tax=Ricinus communis TaxID=3988 RepID=B9S079_RICCO|nr:pentatricopeptide repeat-containing protein, putative [Ricinus communis]